MRTLAFLALIPLAGCSIFAVEGEIPEVCMSFHDRLIEGVEPGDDFVKSFTGDPISALSAFVELDAEIKSATAELTAIDGVTDLAFLESVTVVMRPAGPRAKDTSVSLVDCGDYACASDTLSATLTDVPPAEALDVLAAGAVEIDVVLAGDLPEHDWVVDLEVCLSGRARAQLAL